MNPHNEILSYTELCSLVGGSIQKGINIRYRGKETILLMSQRKNAPCQDRYDPSRNILEYVGHDVRKTLQTPRPRELDQPLISEKGTPSDNAKLINFLTRSGVLSSPERVHIFEKLQPNIWADKGIFELISYRETVASNRRIFVFELKPVPYDTHTVLSDDFEHTRLIPSEIKVIVWKRDKGKCVVCGSDKNLHYDHDLPFSKGGTSFLVENIRILCAKCNLKKGAKIE